MNKYKLENQIEVMQHFLNGGEVEATYRKEMEWSTTDSPSWDWYNFKYRIKQPNIKFPVYAQLKNIDYTLIVKFISHREGEVMEDSSIEYKRGYISNDWTPAYNDAVWKILPDYKEKPKLKTYYEVIDITGSFYNICGNLYSEDELEDMGEIYVKTGRSFELPDKG